MQVILKCGRISGGISLDTAVHQPHHRGMRKAPARRGRVTTAAIRASRDARLPSGRVVSLSVRKDTEELQVKSPDGLLELRVVFGPEGPVVSLQCARLELSAPDRVSVRCRKFEVQATEAVEISGAEFRATTSGNIWLTGEKVLLNCDRPEESMEDAP
jgi:hypothetical protein